MAVPLVLSIAGIFHDAHLLQRSDAKYFIVIAGHLLPLTYKPSKGQYGKYSPSLFYMPSVVVTALRYQMLAAWMSLFEVDVKYFN